MNGFSPRLRIQWIRTRKDGTTETLDLGFDLFQSSIEDSVDSYHHPAGGQSAGCRVRHRAGFSPRLRIQWIRTGDNTGDTADCVLPWLVSVLD